MARSRVPKFGNWESEENVPYTAYFDKARMGRTGGKMINPNDPQENPDLAEEYGIPEAPVEAKAEPEEPTAQKAAGGTHERHKSREDGDLKELADSPARHDNPNRRASSESANQRHGGRGPNSVENPRRPARHSGGSENSMERSPLHPHARIPGRVGGAPSPSWEGGRGTFESSHGTPVRSRLRPESPDKSAAVPKFGEWDESNPSSADGYTHIFNKVREEKQGGGGKVPGLTNEPNSRNHIPDDSSTSCCFCWGRK